MPLIYCDQNFLISAHDSHEGYKERLRKLATEGNVSFVLSTWHWLEMARDANIARGLSVAEFADTLRPMWLFDRRSVQRYEVEEAFFAFVETPLQRRSRLGSLAEAIADLTGTSVEIARGYRDSSAFVSHMQTLGDDHPIEMNIRKNFLAQQQNGEAYRTGRITDEMNRCFDRIYVGGLMPFQTPAGAAIERATKDRFLQGCSNNDFPSFATEAALSLDAWQTGRVLNDSTFRDSQHVVALPYVELFVTNDETLSRAIRRIAAHLPFRTGAIISKEEFEGRFM